jgi:hypothetical protein
VTYPTLEEIVSEIFAGELHVALEAGLLTYSAHVPVR